ncbi:class I SAM-dependent methyltransferase [Nonlabens marinus]|uniref:class I SAM-dependent methyltransferase n=1 Tax=Nonlabens marinus TaxID=930802 RepID=UPI0006983A3B|nr:class I SAM-dependent methyltransferase [Nonlabens marinus]
MRYFLTKTIRRETFNPGFLGFFINPYFFIRRGLYKGIEKNANALSGTLLDFGCGSKPYRKLFNVNEYVGLDIKESGNHKTNKEVDVYYDGITIPFDSHVFDSIFSSEVFEHVFNLDEVMKEINRVCKMEGKLLITVPFVWDEHEIPYDFGRYTSYGIKHVLEKNGFEVLNLEKSTTFVQTIFQLWNSYLFQNVLSNKILKAIFTPILLPPFTLLGIILNVILPKNKDLYHNNIVLAQKVNDIS